MRRNRQPAFFFHQTIPAIQNKNAFRVVQYEANNFPEYLSSCVQTTKIMRFRIYRIVDASLQDLI